MAAGPATQIGDVIVPDVFDSYVRLQTMEKSALVRSGAMVPDSVLSGYLTAAGGKIFTVPFWKDLDNDAERVDTDTSVPFAGPRDSSGATVTLPAGQAYPPDPNKIESGTEQAVAMNRNNSWSTSVLAATLAGDDPMAAIIDRVSAYWTRRLQVAFISAWKGVIADNDANDSGDYTNDVSGGAFADGVTNFTAEAFVDAIATLGDAEDQVSMMMVDSVVYARMKKLNMIDFVPDSDQKVIIPTFLNKRVIVDDGMPRTGNVRQTWIFGPGAVRFGQAAHPWPSAVERIQGAGNGGGQEVLYSRVRWCIHPTGHSWVGANTPDGGPSNTGTANSDLDEAASWNRVYPERKMIKFARLVTREA